MTKYKLLAGTAVVAASLAVTGSASAFTDVDWDWDLDVRTVVNQRITTDVTLTPTGLAVIEDIQIQIGDVTATSTVTGITNNQPGGEIADGEITLFFGGTLDDDDADIPDDAIAGASGEGAAFIINEATADGEGLTSDHFDDINAFDQDGPDGWNFTVTVDTAALELGEALDARTELPEVISAATAVGNNVNIETTVKTDIHEGQYLFDVAEGGEDLNGDLPPIGIMQDGEDTGNDLMSAAFVGALGAVFGVIEKAEISATSRVSDILNATVDSDATAVGNNKSIDLMASTPGDAFLVADINQLSVANVSALSAVRDVELNNYTNLGRLDRAIVDSNAVAVGNNLNISVTSPNMQEPSE